MVQGEVTDGRGADGVDGGQGNDEPLRWSDGELFDGADLGIGHGQEAAFTVRAGEARGGIGEHDAALGDEPEQRAQRGDGVAARPPA